MKHKPFMGITEDAGSGDDGPIFVQTMNQGSDGKLVDNLGNSDMKDFKTDNSAMQAVNSPQVKKEFNLGAGPTASTAIPAPMPRGNPKTSKRLGQLNMKSGEFWGVVGLSFAVGVLGKHLFDTYVK
tara:strand:+ start:153 stop:530 length:378 start_codon:yes stop_codon:yes gene_type:complete